MTAKTPQFPLHYVEDKPQTGFDFTPKGTVAPVKTNPQAEHAALLTLVERGHLNLAPMLGLDTHTCNRCDDRRNA